jgi:Zn-dependent peptidase ImmA (M78 family)/transcriptional regulator with XRE-family HTH domain
VDGLRQADPRVVGRRLADARKARGITQDQAAKHLGCSRPTVIAVEKGTRAAKPREIVELAGLYGRTVHELVRAGVPVPDFAPHLRAAAGRMKGHGAGLERAIAGLQRFADDYRRLEEIMGAALVPNYPVEIDLRATRVDVRVLAEDIAGQERLRLGLGDQPVCDLRRALESDVGLRVLYGDMPSPVAGMYAYVAEVGCCVMVNRRHPPERGRASLAHEYAHVFADRYRPGIDSLRAAGRKPAGERFAEAFAVSFLMPAASVRRGFDATVRSTGDFRVADLCRLSRRFFVSFEAMSRRLEDLGLIPAGTFRDLKESGFKVRRASAALGLAPEAAETEIYPERYRHLAVQAYLQGRLSEGQLARLLGGDRIAAREEVARCLSGTVVGPDGEVRTVQLDSVRSIL